MPPLLSAAIRAELELELAVASGHPSFPKHANISHSMRTSSTPKETSPRALHHPHHRRLPPSAAVKSSLFRRIQRLPEQPEPLIDIAVSSGLFPPIYPSLFYSLAPWSSNPISGRRHGSSPMLSGHPWLLSLPLLDEVEPGLHPSALSTRIRTP